MNRAFYVRRDVVFLVGMAAAGLADLFDVRLLFLAGSLVLLGAGLLVLVLPGLGQPAAQWRQAMHMLRAAPGAPRLDAGRPATLADLDLLAGRLPSLSGWSARDRQSLAAHARVSEAPPGTAIVRQGDTGDDAYFILDGRAVVGRDDEGSYHSLEVLHAGDFFGEIAALTGVPRTANVIAEQPTTVLQIPASTLRHMMSDPQVNRTFLSTMTERMLRLHMIDLPRYARLDQQSLRELRTPDAEPST